MKIVVDAQQKQIDYETVLQTIAKDGLIYGLGVGKTRWKFQTRMQTKVEPSLSDPEIFVETPPQKSVTFDDAVAERVDPFDFIWDPQGDSIETVRVGHPPALALRRSSSRRWSRPGLARAGERPRVPVDAGRSARRRRARRKRSHGLVDQRLAAEGYGAQSDRADRLHEVWEYHDGEQVITVLDGLLSGAGRAEPVSGEARIPFQTYRPTSSAGASSGSLRSSRSSTSSTRSTRSEASAATPRR